MAACKGGGAAVPAPGRQWGVGENDNQATYPAEQLLTGNVERWLRAIDVDAPRAVTFRRLCQLKRAPYSYDVLDNLGRRSPRDLTPGTERLEVGQRFLVFRIDSFESNVHISGISTAGFSAVYGKLAVSYTVVDRPGVGSRIVVCLLSEASSRPARLRRRLLGVGDLVMMRKQLRTLKELAEMDARPTEPAVDR